MDDSPSDKTQDSGISAAEAEFLKEADDARVVKRKEAQPVVASTQPAPAPEESHVATRWSRTPSVKDQANRFPDSVRHLISCAMFELPKDLEGYNAMWNTTQGDDPTSRVVQETQEFFQGTFYVKVLLAQFEFKQL